MNCFGHLELIEEFFNQFQMTKTVRQSPLRKRSKEEKWCQFAILTFLYLYDVPNYSQTRIKEIHWEMRKGFFHP